MGGPYALASVIDKLPAVVTDYYGGPHQAIALADAIFGVTNPGGKLPFTMPRHVGQVPIHYAQKWDSGYRRTKDDIHKGYLDMPSTPLFSFGHGLSYTTFEYSQLKLASDTVDVNGEARVSLTVTNTGKRRGRRGRAAVRGGHGDRRHIARTATRWVRATRARARRIEDRHLRRADERARLHRRFGRSRDGARPGGTQCRRQFRRQSSADIRSTATFTIRGKTRTIRGEDRAFFSVATVGS